MTVRIPGDAIPHAAPSRNTSLASSLRAGPGTSLKASLTSDELWPASRAR